MLTKNQPESSFLTLTRAPEVVLSLFLGVWGGLMWSLVILAEAERFTGCSRLVESVFLAKKKFKESFREKSFPK